MSPSNKEMQLQKNCQLYAYLLKMLDKEIPEEIQECIYSYDYVTDCGAELFLELQNLDSDTFEKIVHNPESQKSRELSYWWEMKQEADRLHKSLSSDM